MTDLLYATLLAACGLAVLALLSKRRKTRPAARWALRLVLPPWILLLAYLPVEAYFVWGYDTTDTFAVTRLSERWLARHGGPSNLLGLRDWEFQPGSVRGLMIGDSFAWGYGVPDIADRVGGRLAARLGVPVATCARPGSDTPSQAEMLAAWTAHYGQPEWVVQAYVFNDAPATPAELRLDDGQPAFPTPPPPFSWVLDHSISLDLLYHRAWALTDRIQGLTPAIAGRYRGDMTAHEAELLALHEQITGRGARHLLVAWPFHDDGHDFDHAYAWLADAAARLRIPYLDLRPAFAETPANELIVGLLDRHPNARAHDLAAAAIAEKLGVVAVDSVGGEGR